jgi:hypothetical protein
MSVTSRADDPQTIVIGPKSRPRPDRSFALRAAASPMPTS